ncbi:DUF4132 domain-containing protein [Massilia sp. CCM 8733]|uniref:DUF4132 domain-containing protein n=1 Tax=Massilia mucilaginosa TaxID=2609282 RepID=A0ABX0NPB9_9BURK|nr:DUF4132 domain-containing protein [Massilia mucilaginosa]NHZ88572.1 DUF4132 domain-containing protein [Massilia mucilaginosa]
MRRFELSDGASDKFWQIGQDGCDVNVCYGRIGSAGTSQTKQHADAGKAAAAIEKLIREKCAKGYAEINAGACPTPPPAPVAPVSTPATGEVAPWLAVAPLIDLPRALAARAMASRRFPGAPPNADAAACWDLFISRVRRYADVAPDNSPKSFQDAVSEAVARISGNLRSGSPASDLVLLAVSTLVEDKLAAAEGAPFLDFLVAAKGLPYALQVLIDMERVSIEEHTNQYGMCWYMGERGIGSFSPSNDDFGSTELAMRAHLAHAPQEVWEQCVGMIRAALPTLPVRRQPLFGVLLPDLPDLSDALALALAQQEVDTAAWLRLSASAPAALRALDPFVPSTGTYAVHYFYNLPAAVATMVQERGIEAVDLLKDGAGIDATGEALAHIGTPDALRALALACEASKKSLKRLASAAKRWPCAALAALSELAAAKQAPAAASAVLADLVLDHADQVADVKPWMSAPAAALLDAVAARAAAPADLADLAELPAVLRSPPWLAAPKPGANVLTLAPLDLAPVIRWSEDERQELLKQKRYNAWPYNWKRYPGPADAAAAIAAGDVAKVVALWEAYSVGGYEIGGCVHAIADMPAPFNAAVWSTMSKYEINSPGYAIATLGLAGLPALVGMCERRPADELPYARYFGVVALAAPVARAYATLKSKSARELARAWLLDNPEHAACGLIAPALGKAGSARDAAVRALHLLAEGGHETLLADVASRYQQSKVSEALRALLDEDPLDRLPAKIGPLPAFWMPRNWTRPRLASNGKALPDAALDPIGVMLRFPQADGVYPGIAHLRQVCTGASLADFAWDLFNAWTDAGADAKENWAFSALRLFGNDDIARKLTPLIRAWPGESQHQRAILGLDILCEIGTDTALMLLNGIAQKVKFKALQDNAREKIGQIAEARKLSVDELEDRLAPDLGLDDDGALLLDFGPRQFRVGFDETLKPYVRDADGARLADLPKPKKTDDAALSGAAQERFKLLKKDARTIAAQQVLRLEQAMCTQRRWQPQVFFTFLAGHPLVRHLVQRLVWGAYAAGPDGRLLGCFRVGPDGALTSAADEVFDLPPEAVIGIPHALDLPAAEASAFGQLFADYELLQPFAQIGRDTYALTGAESGTLALTRWDSEKVPTGRVLGLTNKGWRRGDPQDGGWIGEFYKPLGDGRLLELHLDPGLIVGMPEHEPEQRLKEVRVTDSQTVNGKAACYPLSTLGSIVASELIRDMQDLCA